MVLNEGNAAAAASIAILVSSTSNSGAFPMSFPVDGSVKWTGKYMYSDQLMIDLRNLPVTSKVCPEAAFTHSPLTYATPVLNKVGSLSFGTACDIVEAFREVSKGKVDGWNRERGSILAVDLIMLFMLKEGIGAELGAFILVV